MRLFSGLTAKTFFILLTSCSTLVENVSEDRMCGLNPVFRTSGDLRLAVIVNECSSSSLSLRNSIVLISGWICERLNVLNLFGHLKMGADIYKVCEAEDMIDPFINIAKTDGLGVVSWNPVPSKIHGLSKALEIQVTVVTKEWRSLVTVAVGLVSALHWNENLTIITDDPEVLTLFFHQSRKVWICVQDVRSFRDSTLNSTNPTILFGNGDQIHTLLKTVSQQSSYNKLIVIPLDGTEFEGLPDGSYVVQPIYADAQQKSSKSPRIIPSSLLLDVAVPFINIAKNVSSIIHNQCNQSTEARKCLKSNFKRTSSSGISQRDVLEFLRIEPLYEKFNYNIYKSEYIDLQSQKLDDDGHNTTMSSDFPMLQSFIKVGVYNLFNYSLDFDEIFEGENSTLNASFVESCWSDHKLCIYKCLNFKSIYRGSLDDEYLLYNVVLKQEPWILAVLSIATLGILFCTAILIFIFVRLCKKDIFEGNPVLSVLLLLTLTTMYASVVPFGLEVTFETEFRSILSDYLCLGRSLSVTLTYSCVFSLMLSRSVMLATVAYEAGFMSHITGHVQSLLCLFMIAVQGALSLQSVENCQDLLASNSFLYALSYDILLLALLVCSCPFIYRSQRNYKEGCYFAIAILLIVVCWMAWVTVYVLVDEQWKSTAVCCGLLGTASAVLGAVFIPRTYLMTSAVVRDSLTSALPSLAFASSTSVLDLNYTNAQHVYDCVNIATINANISQTMPPTSVPQLNPNFYSDEPNLETTEINTNHSACESPDKVTRF